MSERSRFNDYRFELEQDMNTPAFAVERISDRLNFGHGPISIEGADSEVLLRMDEAIRSTHILTPIDKDDEGKVIDDDGCGDGRSTLMVFTKDETYKRSLNRSKVFGGGVTMNTASLIGTGQAIGLSLPHVFSRSIETLEQEGVDFGAHTDEHAHGENCGCGAIDKAPEAVMAAIKYENPIREVIKMLGSDTSELDVVYSNWRRYTRDLAVQPAYSGREVADKIISRGKVMKQLAGDHRERAIVLNTVPGYTVDQAYVRQETNNEAQSFAVDVWRLQEISEKAYKNPTAQNQAYLSKLIYTLAVSAVLTKGDLPVYMTQSVTPR